MLLTLASRYKWQSKAQTSIYLNIITTYVHIITGTLSTVNVHSTYTFFLLSSPPVHHEAEANQCQCHSWESQYEPEHAICQYQQQDLIYTSERRHQKAKEHRELSAVLCVQVRWGHGTDGLNPGRTAMCIGEVGTRDWRSKPWQDCYVYRWGGGDTGLTV